MPTSRSYLLLYHGWRKGFGECHGGQQIQLDTFLPLANITCKQQTLPVKTQCTWVDVKAPFHQIRCFQWSDAQVANQDTRGRMVTFCWTALTHHSSTVDQDIAVLVIILESRCKLVKGGRVAKVNRICCHFWGTPVLAGIGNLYSTHTASSMHVSIVVDQSKIKCYGG